MLYFLIVMLYFDIVYDKRHMRGGLSLACAKRACIRRTKTDALGRRSCAGAFIDSCATVLNSYDFQSKQARETTL